jgi:uncharacterized protein DUF4384
MGIPRLSPLAIRTAAILPLLVALTACATAGGARSVGAAGSREAAVERGPRAHIWTTDEFGTGNRIRPSFRLDDDAYVIVVNVGLDGYANVIFPESPEDDGFMRGGRTYRLPAFFPGFANTFRGSRYSRLYTATSSYDGIYDRYAGYVFIIASWRPMHFQVTEAVGLWDDYRLAGHEERLEPYVVMHRFADQLVPGPRDYTARFARYAAFSGGFAGRSSFSSCALYGLMFGYSPLWTFQTIGNAWIPAYGIDYYGAGAGCGYAGISLAGFRPFGRIIVRPPVRPTPAPPPGSGDTVSKPRYPRRPRPPVVASDSAGRKSPPRGRRVEVAVEDDPVIDVTRETRERARRDDRDADRRRRALNRERGYEATDEWRGRERDRATDRIERSRDIDPSDGPRARGRPTVDDDSRTRAEPARPSEPRREPPPRAEPRAEPPQEPRPQPPPRSDPPPRSERPAKPADPP